MNYISPRNTKAIAHFESLGCKLTPRERMNFVSRIALDNGYYDYPAQFETILIVEGNNFSDMSGTRFHQYLEKHGLLLSQQD